jgi:hypothetical protein
MKTLRWILYLLAVVLMVSCIGKIVNPPTAQSDATGTVEIKVYFENEQLFLEGQPPFEEAVTRRVFAGENLPEAALNAYFQGPTLEEQVNGLVLLTSGFSGWQKLNIVDGVAHLYMTGDCFTNGAMYTIYSPILRTLTQFEGIRYLKMYDTNGQTTYPEGNENSAPACLEP